MLKGIAASSGVAIAKVFKYEEVEITVPEVVKTVEEEVKCFEEGLKKTISGIEKVKERAAANLSEEELGVFDAHLGVFDAHLAIANDPDMGDQIKGMIKDAGMNAVAAAKSFADTMISIFGSMEDAYMKERAADIKDVTNRLMINLLGYLLVIQAAGFVYSSAIGSSSPASLSSALVGRPSKFIG